MWFIEIKVNDERTWFVEEVENYATLNRTSVSLTNNKVNISKYNRLDIIRALRVVKGHFPKYDVRMVELC